MTREREETRIEVAASKSVAARAYVLAALAGGKLSLPDADEIRDVKSIREALEKFPSGGEIYVDESGTAFRFLTAVAAAIPGERTITGAPSLLRRPITPLAAALRNLGADITVRDDGSVAVHGKTLTGGTVTIDGGISSQYVSALMMIAPLCEKEMEIRFPNPENIVSIPYITLTAQMMETFGVTSSIDLEKGLISIPSGRYTMPEEVTAAADWTSASYILAGIVLRGSKDRYFIPNLHYGGENAVDCRCLDWLAPFGLEWREEEKGLSVWCTAPATSLPDTVEIDFSSSPDLFPTFAVFCALMGRKYRFTGVRNLRIKESDRLRSVATGLDNMGFEVEIGEDTFTWNGKRKGCVACPEIDSFGDHRIAMSFSLAASRMPVRIKGAGCVDKSFPQFFSSLSPLFRVEVD